MWRGDEFVRVLSGRKSGIKNAIEKVLQQGYRTSDIMSDNKTLVGTKEMGDLIVANL